MAQRIYSDADVVAMLERIDGMLAGLEARIVEAAGMNARLAEVVARSRPTATSEFGPNVR